MPAVIVALVALGAVGLFLALPGKGALRWLGAAPLLAALAAAVALGISVGGDERWVYGVLATVSLAAAARVITHEKPVYSALYFILVIISTAAMMMLMQASFLAFAILIVYAGAILVTYVFVIMLAQQGQQRARYDVTSREPLLGAFGGMAVVAVITGALFEPGAPLEVPVEGQAGTIAALGELLLTQYVVAVQLAGVLLLAAMVGAIAIAKRTPLPDDVVEAD